MSLARFKRKNLLEKIEVPVGLRQLKSPKQQEEVKKVEIKKPAKKKK